LSIRFKRFATKSLRLTFGGADRERVAVIALLVNKEKVTRSS
jgi:hypothetical protein